MDKPPDETAQAEIQRRKELSDTYSLFERWRNDMIQRLNACFRAGHLALKNLTGPEDFDRLTDAQALAIRSMSYIEFTSDVLSGGTMAEMMEIFREREAIEQLCGMILNSTPMKSGAA